VAFMQELPFEEGRPLSPITEEGESSTELLDHSRMANHSPDCQVCMASLRNVEDDELDSQSDNEQLTNVSAHEPVADAPQDEDKGHRRILRAKNAKRAQRRRNMQNRARVPMDGQHLVSPTRNQPSKSERHGDTTLVSRTPGGGHRSWRNDNRQRNQDHPSARDNNEQEVQQPPRNQRGARHHDQDQLKANLHDAPTIDLMQKINEGRNAPLVIEARRRDHTGRHHDDDDSDRFPAFTTSITDKSYPTDFKPVGIPKYDGKENPRQWIRCYSVAIKVSGDPTSPKLSTSQWVWSPRPSRGLKASCQTPLTRGRTSSRLVNNFQGSMIRAGTRHDLS
jgi:hypothetical protein